MNVNSLCGVNQNFPGKAALTQGNSNRYKTSHIAHGWLIRPTNRMNSFRLLTNPLLETIKHEQRSQLVYISMNYQILTFEMIERVNYFVCVLATMTSGKKKQVESGKSEGERNS